MFIDEYRYDSHSYPSLRQRISSSLDRMAERATRGILKPFVLGFLSRAKEDMVINNDQIYELADRLDKRL